MQAYIIRRIMLLIPTLFLVTLIVFLTVRFIPGTVLDLMVAEIAHLTGATDIDIEALKHMLGMDVPIHIQYVRWLGIWPGDSGFAGILQGNLGVSLWSAQPVVDEIAVRLPVTLELALFAIITTWTAALPVGIYSAIRQDTMGDYVGRSFSLFWVAAPNFWLATMLIVYPSIWWGWTPAMEYITLAKDPVANLIQFMIPGFLMGMAMSGGMARYARTMMLEVLRQDYIRTAWSKGLRERTVIVRHAFRNTLIPLVTLAGMLAPIVLGGTVIIEQIFALPGIGRLFFQALTQRDYPIISGVNLLVATVVLTMNLVVDISYAYLDPRVRLK